MEQEDDWNPDIQGQSILKVKVINFTNNVVDQNIQVYNSKPTPHQVDNEQQQQAQQVKMQTQQQNLYDPLNDEQEQAWVDQKLKKTQNNLRPLVCPGCFTAVCYAYSKTDQQQINISKQVVNCKYNPYPLDIPDLKVLEKFDKIQLQKINNQDLQKINNIINIQEQQINLKFQLECEECQNIVGYYQTQNNQYQLINLI